MPKLLDNIKEKAIEEARREMLSDGYRAMTIRRVAKELGIATGTLYNYFPSKEYLAPIRGDPPALRNGKRFYVPFPTFLGAVRGT